MRAFPAEFVLRSSRVVTPDGVRPAALRVRDGRIADVGASAGAGLPLFDMGEAVVMPGVVDTHVHFNDPGRADWEGVDTGTRAAAAGGVTTVVDMPLNSIPATVDRAALNAKREAFQGRTHVDVGFWGGVVPGNTGQLAELLDGGVLGFKCFLVPSGVDEFPAVGEEDLREALAVLAPRGAVLLAHAEVPGPIARAASSLEGANPRRYDVYLASRPRAAEHDAIALLIRLAKEFGARIHIVHLASGEAVPLVRDAREAGVRMTVETCPHYLFFCAEDVSDGATALKCAPPIRGRADREALWSALGNGVIDLIASDHSPAPAALKHIARGDFLAAWGGIASIQLALPAVWTQARARGYRVDSVARWLCAGPARLAGLDRRKGAIAEGRDADLVVWHPDESFVVEAARLEHRHPICPYDGHRLDGRVELTLLRGQAVFDSGEFAAAPRGRVLDGRGVRL